MSTRTFADSWGIINFTRYCQITPKGCTHYTPVVLSNFSGTWWCQKFNLCEFDGCGKYLFIDLEYPKLCFYKILTGRFYMYV